MAQVQYTRDYNHIKTKLKNDYNVDVDENTLKEFEESVLKTDGNGVIISNTDFFRRYVNDNCGWSLKNETNVLNFEEFFKINEDGGVATATVGNVSGMGAVVSPVASQTAGQTTSGGSNVGDSFGNGGVVGSGDIAVGSKGNSFGYGGRKSKRGKKKNNSKKLNKMGNQIDSTTDYIKTSGSNVDVTKFSDFQSKESKKK